MTYKILFFLCLPLSVLGQKDKANIRYAPMCRDSINMEKIIERTYADWYFFGDSRRYLKFFEINLRQMLLNNKTLDGHISIVIDVDTLGFTTDVRFVKKLDVEEPINTEIINAVKRIKRWRPSCQFDVLKNEFVCKNFEIYVELLFKQGRIYLPEGSDE